MLTSVDSTHSSGRVLIADDEPAVLRTYQRVLRSLGYEVETAPDGRAAAQLIAQGEYDLVLSDVQMPEMSGLDLLRKVRDTDRDIPFIVLTGDCSGRIAVEAMDCRASRYLNKPIEPAALKEAVGSAVALGRLIRAQRAADLRGSVVPPSQLATFEHALDSLTIVCCPLVRGTNHALVSHEIRVETDEPSLADRDALIAAALSFDALHRVGRTIRQRVAALLDPCEDYSVVLPIHAQDLLDEQLFRADAPLALFADRVVLEIADGNALAQLPNAAEAIRVLNERGYRVEIGSNTNAR